MSSLREQILARVQAVLLNNTPAGLSVFRAREVSLTRAVSPAITVLFGGEQDKRIGSETDAHELKVIVAIFVRGDPWDSLADALAVPVHQLLMADAKAGGSGGLAALGVNLWKTSTEPEAEEADRTSGTFVVTYHANYLTSASDMSRTPAP